MDDSVSLEIQELLSKYPQLFKLTKVNSQAGRTSGQVTSRHILTNSDVPVFAAASARKKEVAKKEFKDDLLADGIIRPCNSPWVSPWHYHIKLVQHLLRMIKKQLQSKKQCI